MSYSDKTYTISAGASVGISGTGVFVACLAASKPFKLEVDSQNAHTFEAGLTRRKPQGFKTLRIENPNDTPIEVRLGIGSGDIDDNRVTINNDEGLATRAKVPDAAASGLVVVNDATTLQLVPDTPLRTEIIFSRSSEETGLVYIHTNPGAASAAKEGVPMLPGSSLTLNSTAALYVSNNSGAVSEISFLEAKFST